MGLAGPGVWSDARWGVLLRRRWRHSVTSGPEASEATNAMQTTATSEPMRARRRMAIGSEECAAELQADSHDRDIPGSLGRTIRPGLVRMCPMSGERHRVMVEAVGAVRQRSESDNSRRDGPSDRRKSRPTGAGYGGGGPWYVEQMEGPRPMA
jgi:hypothetical protein